jgi:hypothetical protein
MPDTTSAPTTVPAALPHVEVLHWPTQERRRRLLASLGEPRLLLLAPGSTPPSVIDDLEQWIPEAADPVAIVRGVTNLQHRIFHSQAEPVLDDDGLVRFRGRWVAVSDTQLPVVDYLIRNYRRLVSHDDLARIYHDNGGAGTTDAARRNFVRRIADRVGPIGLRIHVVRKRGVILTDDAGPPASRPHRPTGPATD